MTTFAENKLSALFENWCGNKIDSINKLPPSGSNRAYYRLKSSTNVAIGMVNHDIRENLAFVNICNFFKSKSLRVPEIHAVDESNQYYILEDLGNSTLFDWLSKSREGKELPARIIEFYKLSINELVKFQFLGKELDFNCCYPRQKFDEQSISWDLQYFKYYYLKLAGINFDEQLLEQDFKRFTSFLLQVDTSYFLYRDFQSRNIMVTPHGPAFIDFQGGRQGSLQYDIASLLYDAKADLSNTLRDELLEYYIQSISKQTKIDRKEFIESYHGYVFIRIMQAMGAYGFRGMFEKKEHFLASIPHAINNIRFLLDSKKFPSGFPVLERVLLDITKSRTDSKSATHTGLTVSINSFSYKRGIPVDITGHGGGFAFDCRAIENPGKIEQFREKTGKDAEIHQFFENNSEMSLFLNRALAMVDASVEKYISRGFSHLTVNFGCTGGQHRSVYCAEKLCCHLKSKYKINVELKHVELEMKKSHGVA